MVYKIFYIIPFLFFLYAGEVTSEQIEIISNNFINSRMQMDSIYVIKSIETINTKDDYIGLYIVTLNPVGFIIISGDVNMDEIVNIQDLVLLVNFVLGIDSPSNDQFNVGDINVDGSLDILDIIAIVNIILDN